MPDHIRASIDDLTTLIRVRLDRAEQCMRSGRLGQMRAELGMGMATLAQIDKTVVLELERGAIHGRAE